MEFYVPKEDAALPPEFSAVPEPRDMPDEEYQPKAAPVPAEEDRHSRIKRMLLMPMAATVAAVSMVFASFGYDPLGFNVLGGGSPAPVSPTSPTTPGGSGSPTSPTVPGGPAVELPDGGFPGLSNLERNGYLGYLPAHNLTVNGYLNENYITVVELDGTRTPVLYNSSGTEVVDDSIPGLSYNGVTNTLTMTNYDGPVLDINMMGNGFKIRLVGDNKLEHLGLWGFYLGGSVTITGSGTLTVNQKKRFAMGIQMDAEWSETCLMVDSGVKLEVFGSPTATFEIGGDPARPRDCRGAIVVSCTTMDKAIYFLAPLTLTGGVRAAGIFGEDAYYNHSDDYTFGSFHDYSIVDEEGNPSMHVLFE